MLSHLRTSLFCCLFWYCSQSTSSVSIDEGYFFNSFKMFFKRFFLWKANMKIQCTVLNIPYTCTCFLAFIISNNVFFCHFESSSPFHSVCFHLFLTHNDPLVKNLFKKYPSVTASPMLWYVELENMDILTSTQLKWCYLIEEVCDTWGLSTLAYFLDSFKRRRPTLIFYCKEVPQQNFKLKVSGICKLYMVASSLYMCCNFDGHMCDLK